MTQDTEQTTPREDSNLVHRRDTLMLPFDIDDYLPEQPRRSPWAVFSRRGVGGSSGDESIQQHGSSPALGVHGSMPRLLLTIAALLLLAFGIVRIGISTLTSQAAYPGVTQCYEIELWLHEVDTHLSRIQWALADAEEEITNEEEAEEANDRIWQMFVDMRASLATNPVPEELTELRALWFQYLDMAFEIRDLEDRNETEDINRLRQEHDAVLAQRLEEEERVRRNCRLTGSGSDSIRASQVHNASQLQTITSVMILERSR